MNETPRAGRFKRTESRLVLAGTWVLWHKGYLGMMETLWVLVLLINISNFLDQQFRYTIGKKTINSDELMSGKSMEEEKERKGGKERQSSSRHPEVPRWISILRWQPGRDPKPPALLFFLWSPLTCLSPHLPCFFSKAGKKKKKRYIL